MAKSTRALLTGRIQKCKTNPSIAHIGLATHGRSIQIGSCIENGIADDRAPEREQRDRSWSPGANYIVTGAFTLAVIVGVFGFIFWFQTVLSG
jgi:hypothetical protein